MEDNKLSERVAVLESRMENVQKDQLLILQELRAIHNSLIKYKGFVGGITFFVTCIFTFLTYFKDWAIAHLK